MHSSHPDLPSFIQLALPASSCSCGLFPTLHMHFASSHLRACCSLREECWRLALFVFNWGIQISFCCGNDVVTQVPWVLSWCPWRKQENWSLGFCFCFFIRVLIFWPWKHKLISDFGLLKLLKATKDQGFEWYSYSCCCIESCFLACCWIFFFISFICCRDLLQLL